MRKKYSLIALLFLVISNVTKAQDWSLTGNAGTTNANFIGTTDNKNLLFKANNKERGRLLNTGFWRLGSTANYAQVDTAGKLSFVGSGGYIVGDNKYIFRYSGDATKGLYLNSSVNQYQFLNSTGNSLLFINGDNGNSGVLGTFKIGAYTLPKTDGTNGQVLTTNGSGIISWSTAAASGANISLSNLSATSINQGLVPNITKSLDIGSVGNYWRNIYGTTYYVSGVPFLKNNGFADITFVGNAGNTSTSSGNTAIGGSALISVSTGAYNTATGFNSLTSNNSGTLNTAIGYNTLYLNTTGNSNVAVGAGSLYKNTTGGGNVALGYNTLAANQTGVSNTATGYAAMAYNTTGFGNTASGITALYQNTTGYTNSAFGDLSLFNNTTGFNNVAVGNKALYTATQNSGNVAIGDSTLYAYSDGSFTDYMVAIGSGTLSGNTTGYYNTAVGGSSMKTNATGYANTTLGTYSNVGASNLTNATAIGYATVVDASNKVRVGNTSVISIGGQVGWTIFSDGRYKRNIKENVKGLEFINALRPVTYTVDVRSLNNELHKNIQYKEEERTNNTMQQKSDAASAIVHTGFIAQEVEAAAKKLNFDFDGVDKPAVKDGLYGLRYDEFVVPLVKAVQQLSKLNNDKDEALKQQQQQIDELKQMMLQLQQAINACSPCAGSSSSLKSTAAIVSGDVRLFQNAPNPFASATVVNYVLPQKYTQAYINITDKAGRSLQHINISGSGKGQVKVDGSLLSNGAYQYTLIVDGKTIATKQMMVVK